MVPRNGKYSKDLAGEERQGERTGARRQAAASCGPASGQSLMNAVCCP